MPDILYLNRAEAAQYLTAQGLRVSKTTLQKLVSVGGGPEYYRFGGRVVYSREQLDAWAMARLGKPRRHSQAA